MILQKLDIDEDTLRAKPEIVPSEVYAAIREHFCYKVYLVSVLVFCGFKLLTSCTEISACFVII